MFDSSLASELGSAENTQPRLAAWLTLATALSFIGAVAVFLGFAYWATQVVNTQSAERDARFVRAGLQNVFARILVDQRSVTLWDDAVLRVRADDQAWMADNLGQWMGEYYGFDAVYILDPFNRPVHAMRDNETLAPDVYGEDEARISPLVEELRTAMAEASVGLTDSSAAITPLGAEDVVLFDDTPAFVSVTPIAATSASVEVAPGSEYLHVAVRRIDTDVLTEIAEEYELTGARLITGSESEQGGESRVPVANDAGQTLGYIAWMPARPGSQVVLAVAPGFIAAVLVGAVFTFLLLRRLRRASAELQASRAQALFLAFHDTLTGLPNRALFLDRLDRALVATRRTGKRVALHSIDLDRFKSVNDTRGHAAGDELIRLVGSRLTSVLRESDTVARLGGDEFAVVQTDVAKPADAERVARLMLQVIQEPCELLGEKAQVDASIGVVVSDPRTASREEILRKADIALYEAKQRGRGRYELFARDMDEVVARRRRIEDDLRKALESGDQLAVEYQPLFASDGKTVVGAEALVRWNHPERGVLPPDLFVGIAEERALIEPLGNFMLREAATFALKSGLPWVAVNVSPIQFRDDRFASRVLQILKEVGLPPNRLQLEVTENALLENPALIERTFAQLRNAGVHIVLDDFGTGYSSINYLRRYVIDKLKIDQSFVREIGQSADADAIVKAMIGLAQSLNLRVTAEGVETVTQRERLAAIGCQELQGYSLSRPVSADDMMAMLSDGRPVTPTKGNPRPPRQLA